jgi:hypothetical protein
MKKNGRKKDHEHKGKPRSLERNKEASHRSWRGCFRIGRNRTQKGVAEEMTEAKKEIRKLKETVEGMQNVAYDAMERLTFSGSAKSERSAPAGRY